MTRATTRVMMGRVARVVHMVRSVWVVIMNWLRTAMSGVTRVVVGVGEVHLVVVTMWTSSVVVS